MTYEELLQPFDKKLNEELFQKAYDEHDTDNMWFTVFRCCHNIFKSYFKKRGVIIEDEKLLEYTTDGCAYCMKFILTKGVRPSKLSSYCYLRCLREITNPRNKWYEMNVVQFPEDNYKKGKDMEMSNNNRYEERHE